MFKSLLRTNRLARLLTLAAVVSLTAAGTMQAAHSEEGQLPNFQQMMDTHATQLGVDANFKNTLQMIDKPSTITFTWKTSLPGVAGGKWQVTDNPKGGPLKTGLVLGAPPAKGATFTIDFCKIAPSEAPSVLKHYYVRIVPVNAKYQPAGMPSDSVDITYLRGEK
jgi:hypothetical protein